MSNDELKKEKHELISMLLVKIDSVKNNSDLKCIYDELKKVNDLLDMYDNKFDNLWDFVSETFKPKTKDKIKNCLNDIFDNYDKKNKDGTFKYSEEDRTLIKGLINKINDICDKDFWERFKKVLGMGT